MAEGKLHDDSLIPPAVSMTWDQVHWRTNQLFEVPPVLLVTECDPLEFRKTMACFIDGRHVNDALYRGVLAIRREFGLEPYPYVVALPEHAAEIPVDVRAVSGEESQLVGILSLPRSIREPPFLLPQLNIDAADLAHIRRREHAIQLLKDMSRDGSEISINDIGDRDDRFLHSFIDGMYRHSYRYVAAYVPEVGE
ncbi:MAG: hypothetical protein KOO61_02500 [Spirochaetales bacterium]|nr:hypothetical protein [Spirochaetales bacterium]